MVLVGFVFSSFLVNFCFEFSFLFVSRIFELIRNETKRFHLVYAHFISRVSEVCQFAFATHKHQSNSIRNSSYRKQTHHQMSILRLIRLHLLQSNRHFTFIFKHSKTDCRVFFFFFTYVFQFLQSVYRAYIFVVSVRVESLTHQPIIH